MSLSVYPTEGSGKTCTKIKETAHTLGGYTECEPLKARHGIIHPRRERVVSHLLYVTSLPDFSVQMKAKRFLQCCLSLCNERHRKNKKNSANDVHCELFFNIIYFCFMIYTELPMGINRINDSFFIFLFSNVGHLLSAAKVRNENEKWKKQYDHFFHFTEFEVFRSRAFG